MDVFDAVRVRRSVRAYDTTPVPKESLDKVLESGRLAPSASNFQPWKFIIVTDKAKRTELSKARYAGFLKESPVVIVGCGDRKGSPEWYAVDTTIALQNMVLTATEEGLGTCWIGSFDEDRVRSLLSIPDELSVVAMLSVGYPRKKLDLASMITGGRNRKALEDVVSYEEYGARR
ncbi:MAG: nitroreductase family protein [Methanobacteriota archaeon]|nr:MAG: nitroreductase family protein [Euryarchaeota archaeon]